MITVVCAIIQDNKGRYFLVQRHRGMKHPLKWEFPGGKIEEGESATDAIVREMREELNAEVVPGAKLNMVEWEYPNKKIGLIPIICELRSSVIHLREHQDQGWFYREELNDLDLLEADIAILNQLP